MPRYSILVEVDQVDALDSAWLALIASRLAPTLPTVPLDIGRDHGPILVSVEADTPQDAEDQVRESLQVLRTSFSVAQVEF